MKKEIHNRPIRYPKGFFIARHLSSNFSNFSDFSNFSNFSNFFNFFNYTHNQS